MNLEHGTRNLKQETKNNKFKHDYQRMPDITQNKYSFMNLKKPENIWLILIIILAAVLRFYHYGSFSYSNDEMSAIARAQYSGFSELVSKGFYVDGHPGGIQVFLWLWIKCFGIGEWSVRFPFVLMGIAAVFMMYKVATTFFGKVTGLFAATALSFLQFSLLYSQIARPYGPGMLFSLMLMYFWGKIFFSNGTEHLQEKPALKHLAGFALSAALCMYTHYFSFLFALIVGFTGFFVSRKKQLVPYILSAIVAALLFVPHIYITLNHLTYKGLSGWLSKQDVWWIFEHIYYIFDSSIFTLSLFLLIISGLIWKSAKHFPGKIFRKILLFWFLAPIVIGYIYSYSISPVLQHPVLIFSFPVLIVLIFSFTDQELNRFKNWLLAAFIVLGFLGTAVINDYYHKQHFGEFKRVAIVTNQFIEKYGESNITKVVAINNPYYINYYFDKIGKKIVFDAYQLYDSTCLENLSTLVSKSKTPYFLFASTKPFSNKVIRTIKSHYGYLADYVYFGEYSYVLLFSNVSPNSFSEDNHLQALNSVSVNPSEKKENGVVTSKKTQVFSIDPSQEYSAGLDSTLSVTTDNLIIEAETEIMGKDEVTNSVLVITLETAEGKNISWNGAESSRIEQKGEWRTLMCISNPGKSIPKGAKLKVYLWNKNKKSILMSAIKINTFKRKISENLKAE